MCYYEFGKEVMHMKKFISVILATVLLTFTFGLYAQAIDRRIEIRIDGKAFESDISPRLIGDTTYVPIYKFCSAISTTKKSFDDSTKTARLTVRDIDIYVTRGKSYIVANGRYICTGLENIIIDDTMFVPVRSIAKAIGAEVIWNGSDYSVDIKDTGKTIQSGDSFYNENDLLWLSRIIYAESNTEPFDGKIAVGNVVLNRVRSNEFPSSVYGVIFDTKYGTQFTPVENGSIYNTPSDECVIAAKICLEGYTVSNSILYFMDAKTASNMWTANNRKFAFSIGNHSFYY